MVNYPKGYWEAKEKADKKDYDASTDKKDSKVKADKGKASKKK